MIESPEFTLWDYRDRRGRNDIAEWMRRQQKRQRGQLNLKLDMLHRNGSDVGRNVLMRMSATIFKLKGKTKGVQLRPMVCFGPIEDDRELTILVPAVEENWKLNPSDAVPQAESRRQEVIDNPKERRVTHERID